MIPRDKNGYEECLKQLVQNCNWMNKQKEQFAGKLGEPKEQRVVFFRHVKSRQFEWLTQDHACFQGIPEDTLWNNLKLFLDIIGLICLFIEGKIFYILVCVLKLDKCCEIIFNVIKF